MRNNTKAFTLVEMLVSMAVSAIIVAATYASYELVAKQYKKNIDIAEMHTSGRALMQIIERQIRMSGFEHRDLNGTVTYGSIVEPIVLTDSGNKCCDEVTVIYDEASDVVNGNGEVVSSSAERIKIRFWVEPYTSNRSSRHRLYQQKDILGRNDSMLANPITGPREVMADYIEDFQIIDVNALSPDKANNYVKIDEKGKELPDNASDWSCVHDKDNGLLWEVKTSTTGLHFAKDHYTWYDNNPLTNGGNEGKKDNWFKPKQKLQNSKDFLGAVNGEALCGYSLWRLPEIEELRSIWDKSKPRGIDANFFPNTIGTASTWTATEDIDHLVKNKIPKHRKGEWVITIEFKGGGGRESGGYHKSNVSHIRAVYQFTGININKLFAISLTLRSKNNYGKDRLFKKKDYDLGNYKLNITDQYMRNTFSSTVAVRNL